MQALDPLDAETVLDAGTLRPVTRGSHLMEAGDAADGMYVVLQGRFAVLSPKGELAIAEIGPGEPVGEFGLVSATTRSATVVALEDSVVWQMEGAGFEALLSNGDRIATALLRGISSELCARFRGSVRDGAAMVPGLCAIPQGAELLETLGWEVL
jgi:NTE family protein